jgi:hypothetical protein
MQQNWDHRDNSVLHIDPFKILDVENGKKITSRCIKIEITKILDVENGKKLHPDASKLRSQR